MRDERGRHRKGRSPRIEIALGSVSGEASDKAYVAVAMLHLPDGEILYRPLSPTPTQDVLPHLDRQAAAALFGAIYDLVCERWGTSQCLRNSQKAA